MEVLKQKIFLFMIPPSRAYLIALVYIAILTTTFGFVLVVFSKQYTQLSELSEALTDHGPVHREATVVSTDLDQRTMVLEIFAQDVKLITPQYLRAHIGSQVHIFKLTPRIEGNTLVGFSNKTGITLDAVTPGDRVLATIIYNADGVIEIVRMTILSSPSDTAILQ